MDQSAVTTQPLRSSAPTKEVHPPTTDETDHSEKQDNSVKKENISDSETLTEETAVFDTDTGHQKEKVNKRREQEYGGTDCCCVYTGDSDPFGMYILCHWICDCFQGIGHCTEDCFEGCADCLGQCCEGDGGAASPDDCDCLSCLDCCTCDGGNCLSGCGDCLSS